MQLFSQDFEVAPVLISFDANPGELQVRNLVVRNHGNETQKFVLNLADYVVSNDGTKEAREPGSTSRSLSDWITINPSFVELLPNEETNAELIIRVPRTGFSTRWGMIQVEAAKEQGPAQADKQLATGVILVPRIIVLMKQSPRSNQNYKGSVSQLKELPGDNSGMRSFEATLTNEGDKILDASVFLALANLETAEEKTYNKKTVSVYPDQELKVTLTLPEQPAPGKYALAFLMDYGQRSAIEGTQILLDIE